MLVECSSDFAKMNAKQCCGAPDELVYVNHIMSSFGQKGILYNIVFLALEGFFYWFMTIAIENNWVRKFKASRKAKKEARTNHVRGEEGGVVFRHSKWMKTRTRIRSKTTT